MSRMLICTVCLLFAFPACHEKSIKVVEPLPNQEKDTNQGYNSSMNLSNPALMYGTSIGELLQQFYKQAKWNELIRFISSTSIEKFGKNEIIQSFRRTEFGYDIKLKSKSVMPDGRILLNYQTIKFGTIGVLRMYSTIENDTVKILINDIHPTIEF
jgi:hypothetical protein